MEPHAGKIVLNGAPSQYDRWLPALGAGYAPVDGRSFEELLDFAVKYGGLVNFYNLRDEIDGDWVPFFLTDPTMLLAAIETTDLPALEADYARRSSETAAARDFARKFDLLRGVFELILDLARRLNLYAQRPEQKSRAVGQLTDLLDELIARDLGAQLRTLRAYDEGAGLPGALGRPLGLDYSGFAPVWGLGPVCPDGSIYRGRSGDAKIDHALPRLEPIFRSFLYATGDLRQFARGNFDATLEESDHKPQAALYLAFAQLFRTAQNTVNTIQRRYLDFYYRDLLRESRRGPLADGVYLTFTLAEGEETFSTNVPRGTLFPAGQDSDERDILYAADVDLVVSAATLGQLQTLRVLSGGLYSAAPDATVRDEEAPAEVVRRVLASNIVANVEVAETAGADIDDVAEAQAGWATFGESHVTASEVEVTEPATLGFAVASDYLLLTGGSRTVTLEVYYPAAFQKDVLDPLLAQLYAATGLDANIFQLVLENAFTLYVSTAAGWFRVESYGVAAMPAEETDEPSFGLWFELPSSVPPVVAYDPASEEAEGEEAAPVTDDLRVNASDPAPSLPTLKVYLRQEPVSLSGDVGTVYTYPLSLLAEMEVTSIRIRAEVFDLTDLKLTNTDGEIDASTPFLPFGALPVVGSFLLVQHGELFVKRLATLRLGIQWFNLPTNEDGFKGYYKYYVIGPDGHREPDLYDNQVFRGGLGVQNPGFWSFDELCPDAASPPPPDVYLFRTREDCADPVPTEAGMLCADSTFAPEVYCCKPLPYYDPDESAVRLELAAPSYAFGNSIYSQNVLNAVIEDLPDPATCEEKCAAECQPLADAAECIEACAECLAACPEGTSGPDPTCVKACVEQCLECLLKLAAPCIERVMVAAGSRAGGEAPQSVRERVRTLMAMPAKEHAQFIRQRLDECQALSGKEPGAWEKCLKLFEAILCVIVCAYASSPSSPALAECLDDCQKSLLDAYEECRQKCLTECESLKKELKYPNEPYLPQATKLSVNYTAQCTITLNGSADTCGQFFHLLPFGGSGRAGTAAPEPPTLLPRFTYPGNIYLGFSGLVPPQTLTLLFVMTGEAGGSLGEQLPPVVWEYLADNRWTSLRPAQVRSDTTNGLQQTGVVTLSLPSFDPSGNTVLSPEFQWLRASVAGQAGRFPRCVGIYPHVLTAAWLKNDNTGEHLAKPLPPHTITSSVEELPDIASIDQPIESFGGRPPETARTFDVRVGERLRHKDRAILGWDYERLVLERYPTVWKVQALPVRNPQRGDAPGEVLVVVVSGPDSVQAIDPTTPVLTGAMLEHIETYLGKHASSFVRAHVVNPIYVRIEVTATVEFGAEAAQGAAAVRLNEELVQYLSPWFYDAERAARGGRYASEADISEFIQTRPYVEAMSDITFRYDPPPKGLDWYFLTSARRHRIQEAGAVVISGGRAGY